MKNLYKYGIICLLAITTFTACDDSDNDGGSSSQATSGHYVTSFIRGETNTYYGVYSNEIPSGTIDMAGEGTSYGNFRIRGMRDGYLYGYPQIAGVESLVKYAVDPETSQVVEIAEIDLDDEPGNIAFINETTAAFNHFRRREITIFDPESMQIKARVDMSEAKSFEGHEASGYSGLVYNPVTEKLYATLYTDDDEDSGVFYAGDKMYVEVIDAQTFTWEKTIEHDNALYPAFRGGTRSVVDESGNLYLIAQGQYGIDLQVGPTAPAASRPQIVKITTDSEFDESYAFNPINAIGFENNFFQIFATMVYAGDNKAYGIGTGVSDLTGEMQDLLTKLGANTITAEEYERLTTLVLYSENMTLIEINLETKECSVVDGFPLTAGFWYPTMYKYHDKVYVQVFNSTETGFYKIDPETNAAEFSVQLTNGGMAQGYFDLSASFDHDHDH